MLQGGEVDWDLAENREPSRHVYLSLYQGSLQPLGAVALTTWPSTDPCLELWTPGSGVDFLSHHLGAMTPEGEGNAKRRPVLSPIDTLWTLTIFLCCYIFVFSEFVQSHVMCVWIVFFMCFCIHDGKAVLKVDVCLHRYWFGFPSLKNRLVHINSLTDQPL